MKNILARLLAPFAVHTPPPSTERVTLAKSPKRSAVGRTRGPKRRWPGPPPEHAPRTEQIVEHPEKARRPVLAPKNPARAKRRRLEEEFISEFSVALLSSYTVAELRHISVMTAPLQEELGMSSLMTDGGWTNVGRTTRDWNRDLSPELWDRHLQFCRAKWIGNPWCKKAIGNIVNYVVGSGFCATANNTDPVKAAQVQRWINKWWNVNRVSKNAVKNCTTLAVESELAFRIPPPGLNGISRMCRVLPEWIHNVDRDLGCPDEMIGIKLRVPMLCRDWVEQEDGSFGWTESIREYFHVLREDGTGDGLTGDTVLVQVNTLNGQTRGLSDVLVAYEDLEDGEQLCEAEVEGMAAQRSFAWKCGLKGLSGSMDSRVQERSAMLQADGAPPTGSVLVYSLGDEQWDTESPQLNCTEVVEFLKHKQAQACAGLDNPVHWMSEGTETNKATAAEMSGPAFANIKKRKDEFFGLYEMALRFALQQAIACKAPDLAGLTLADCGFDIVSRDSSDRSFQAVGAGIQSMAQGLDYGEANYWISPTQAATIYQRGLVELGLLDKIAVPANVDQGQKVSVATDEKTGAPTPPKSGVPKN